MLVVLRSQSCLRLEGRARTLSGPSPALSPARTHAPSAWREDLLIRSYPCGFPDSFRSVRDLGRVPVRCSCEPGELEGRSSVWLPAWLPAAHDAWHGDALVLVTTFGPLPGTSYGEEPVGIERRRFQDRIRSAFGGYLTWANVALSAIPEDRYPAHIPRARLPGSCWRPDLILIRLSRWSLRLAHPQLCTKSACPWLTVMRHR